MRFQSAETGSPSISEEQLELWSLEFDLHGFVFFPGLIPVELVDAMREQHRPFLWAAVERAKAGDMSSHRGPGRHLLNVAGRPFELLRGPLLDPRVTAHPFVTALADRILGTWRRGRTQVECAYSGSDFMGWHTDEDAFQDRQQPKTTLRLAFQVPLVDVGTENGPIELIPGSHRIHSPGSDLLGRLPRIHSVRLLTSRGDAFLRDGDVVHRGTPNRTAEPRPMFSQIYRRVSTDPPTGRETADS